MKKYVMALDQGTTSSRAIIFDREGNIVSMAQKEYTQYFPKPGWVEHDPMEILSSQIDVAKEAIEKANIEARNVISIGITNQRETTILWDRESGKPLYNAIVWQCRRTSDMCKAIDESGGGSIIRERTGLLLDPYFSGTKIKWILENVPGVLQKAKKGEVCFGTVDSWLLYNLTGNHYTEPSNASRTLLFNIKDGAWDEDLLDILDIPKEILPEIKPSSADFGLCKKEIFGCEIPIYGMVGDQQASLFGQACFGVGDSKNTYGTGCFALLNIGKKIILSNNRLLTTVAWDLGDGLEYALEGSIFIGGAVVQWLRDQLGIILTSAESEELAFSVKDSDGVYFVPAFVGLGAPYWDSECRGAIFGLTRGSSKAHITRAALEGVAYLSRDLIEAFQQDFGRRIHMLKVDGGASNNRFLMQFQADILGIPVVQSKISETTALGAAYMAGLYCKYWEGKEEIKRIWKYRNEFKPSSDIYERSRMLNKWNKAVEVARAF